MKRLFLRFARLNTFFHTEALANLYKSAISHLVGPIISYGVDINCFRPLPKKECARALKLKESSRFVVGLFHSHVTEARKGILTLIKHLGELSKKFSGKLELLVVGHGSEKVREYTPPELKVTTLSFIKEPYRLAKAINLCDVILYPTQAENLSLTCLYSLACGVPVISFDVGGQKEAITNGVNGYLVEVNDYQDMTDALVRLLENHTLYGKLAEGARFTAEEYFDFEQYIDRLLEYYYDIN
jgi:glycosyltransferase involved in cell wall biosynthesis